MSAEDKKAQAQAQAARRTPFWACLLVFGLLAAEHAIGLAGLVQQHQHLEQTRAFQDQNLPALAQGQQMSGELQSISLDLLAVAQTNAVAKQIIQEFGIRWNPGTNAAPASSQPK